MKNVFSNFWFYFRKNQDSEQFFKVIKMRRIWEKEYYLRASDFDKFYHIKPSAVLDLFQDAAGQHADEIGVGFNEMLKRSYLWVLTKIKFKIVSQPSLYQKVIVKTWPLPPNRLNYRREYCILDENREQLIVGSSEWVVIHSEKRRFLSVPDLYPFTDGFCEETMFEGKLGKISDFDAESTPHVVNAGFCELDFNNHVNNTKYANYVLDAISPSKANELDIFQIDYRKEVLQGTRLDIYHTWQDNTVLAKGQNENGDIAFACRLEYKN